MAYHRINGNMEQILLQHLRGLADNDGYVTFSERAFALDRGVSNTAINNTIKRLQDHGKLEYTNMGKKGTLVHLLKSEQPNVDLRKCPKCGETAHDANSRFCHRCGASSPDREGTVEIQARQAPAEIVSGDQGSSRCQRGDGADRNTKENRI